MGYMKTDSQRKADTMRLKRALAASDADALRRKTKTWSANMPAYSFTSLCPEPEYRS